MIWPVSLQKDYRKRNKQLLNCETQVLFIHRSDIHRNQTCHPTMAMDNIRRPAPFLYCFKCSLAEKNHALGIVIIKLMVLVCKIVFTLEKVLIIKKIDL